MHIFCVLVEKQKSQAKENIDVFCVTENLPKSFEIRTRQEAKKTKDKQYSEHVQLHDTEKGSLIFWTKISKACVRTKESFSQAIHTFFVKFLQENPLDTIDETNIEVTVHIFEDENLSGNI